jgi:hypothetical protein
MSSRDDADQFEQITILSRPHNEHRLTLLKEAESESAVTAC